MSEQNYTIFYDKFIDSWCAYDLKGRIVKSSDNRAEVEKWVKIKSAEENYIYSKMD